MITSHQSTVNTTLNTDRNGCRLNDVTSIRKNTSIPDSLDAHGQLPIRVAWHARPSINEHPACSKLSGAAMVSSVYARKHITVSVRLTSPRLKGLISARTI